LKLPAVSHNKLQEITTGIMLCKRVVSV